MLDNLFSFTLAIFKVILFMRTPSDIYFFAKLIFLVCIMRVNEALETERRGFLVKQTKIDRVLIIFICLS